MSRIKKLKQSEDSNEAANRRDSFSAARLRDTLLAGVCLVGAIVHGASVATVHSPRGSNTAGCIVNIVLTVLSVGLAISGLRCTRPWAKFVGAVVLTVALVHLLAPRVTMTAVEIIYDLLR